MKFLFGLILMSFSLPLLAEVSHSEVQKMLDQMVKENVISATEAEKAKIKMQNISPSQWSDINKQANEVAARSPASVPSSNNIKEVNNIDLDGEQFKQIQKDIERIIPQSP